MRSKLSLPHRTGTLPWILSAVTLLAGCASKPPVGPGLAMSPAQARASIQRALPAAVPNRAGWVADIYAAFAALSLPPTHENTCAVVAVIEQESSFRVNPVVPGMGAIAWREIDSRTEHAGVPRMVVHAALQLKSSTGRTYSDRIDSARTEKDLSDIFEDFIGSVPLGRTLFGDYNPVRTRGPMQVNVAFATTAAVAKAYPYTVHTSIADELFTRRGSVYFGMAHLLAYPAAYDRYIYRFADFNAGQYASRNAAFQRAVSRASGIPLIPDGALLSHDDAQGPGSTELAVRALAKRLNLRASTLHDDLAKAKTKDFEQTPLYQGVFALAAHTAGHPLPAAVVPRIKLHGPKLSRSLSTDWYAHRVDERFQRCLAR